MSSAFVFFRKRVGVNNVEATGRIKLLALHEILPLALKNSNTGFIVPSCGAHMRKDVRVRLNDGMLCWVIGLKHCINLRITQWGVALCSGVHTKLFPVPEKAEGELIHSGEVRGTALTKPIFSMCRSLTSSRSASSCVTVSCTKK